MAKPPSATADKRRLTLSRQPTQKVIPMPAVTPVTSASLGGSMLEAARARWRACLGALVRAAMERDARFRASRQLARMDDHLLRDIGLTRNSRDAIRGHRP